MAEELTVQQKEAVFNRGGNLLVSAAAGSGKTKVLVDRLLSYLSDPAKPANIDDFLIITYTKAAAAELRGKIAAKLSQAVLDDPSNRHIQSQLQRLYLTNISTVHAFCTDLLRQYAYRLDISGDFRVAEENESLELQMAAIDRVLNRAYENADPDFYALVDTQGLGRDDRQIPEIILQVYNSACCHLDPDGWLGECINAYDVSGLTDASETPWGSYLIDDLYTYLDLQISALEKCAELAENSDNMAGPSELLRSLLDQLKRLRGSKSWDAIVDNSEIDFGRLVFAKKCEDTELKGQIKAVRDSCKLGLAKKLRRFQETSDVVLNDIADAGTSARGLVQLIREFMREYADIKRKKRILDFSDLEHMTLDILLGKSRSGPTEVAKELGARYREVMVDEYQDSNSVQDAIFDALTTNRHNCFMVGDVKQSIYQFRLADPGIFLKKYNDYLPAELAEQGQGRKVLLTNNFRSSGAVIDAVNDVFTQCMSQHVGDLDYGDDDALYEGIKHQEIQEPEVELHGILVRENTYLEEASFVAQRICQLLDGKHVIRDGKVLRPIKAEDIAILLRSPSSVGGIFARELEGRGIRCNFGGSVDILQTEEVQTMRAILQIIDNPLHDIPLVAALSSRVFGFTANDLAQIRSTRRNGTIYSAVCDAKTEKTENFLKILHTLRYEAKMNSLKGLIQAVFIHTGIDSVFSAMPNGTVRTENLQSFCMLAGGFESGSAKNLHRFLRYLDALDEKGVPGAGDNTLVDAVTIMSIHKSKGLEFPVVFLSGLSREFNRSSAQLQVVCDKELGIGLNCVDTANRVRYPSVAKYAIAAKILAKGLSEELRILYVAMTRARDRLIMTYADSSLEKKVHNIVCRMHTSDNRLLTTDVSCPGEWVLLAALRRPESGALRALGGYPAQSRELAYPWLITADQVDDIVPGQDVVYEGSATKVSDDTISKMSSSLRFSYPFAAATHTPSKQTATQLKGRQKDIEAAQDADTGATVHRKWRKPSFVGETASGTDYGTAMHLAMQYIRFEQCTTEDGVLGEIRRMEAAGILSEQQVAMIAPKAIADFFATPFGSALLRENNVLREFKFSILCDAAKYDPSVTGESILLQGVVDCAVIHDDGITILDFKTDRVSADTVQEVAQTYREQVLAYADALSRIYSKPVKSAVLYFFSLGQFVAVI